MKFPQVNGSNLLRQKMTLPVDLKGEFNLLLVPFQQWQQMEVDSWISLAKEMEQEHPGLCYYELPTIQRMNVLSHAFINEGMRAGIPNPKTRERTITLYLDKDKFRQALEIDTEAHISIFLIDRLGNIFWRERGPYSPTAAHSLEQALVAVEATLSVVC